MEGVARRINACDDSCFDRFARERGVPPAGHVVIVPCGISQSEKRDLGSRNAMHHAAPTVFAVTHRTPHAFHAVAVFDQPTRIRRPMQKDSPPIVEELATEYDGKLKVMKLNTDENPDIAGKYGIMSIPTLLFFRGGQPVDKVVGAVPKKVLKDTIDKLLSPTA